MEEEAILGKRKAMEDAIATDTGESEEALVASYEAGYYSDDAAIHVSSSSSSVVTPLLDDKVASWLFQRPPTHNANAAAFDFFNPYALAPSLDSGYANNDICRSSRSSSSFHDDHDEGDDALINKPPFLAPKEPLSNLAAEFQRGSPIMQHKIKLLGDKYAALRRTRGDGSCFFRSFMFSYLEHILVTQDRAEVERVLLCIEQCREDLFSLGYAEFTYEEFFTTFTELLNSCLPGTEASLSLNELLEKANDQTISNNGVMLLRFITSAAIQKRADFFEPFISGISSHSVIEYCKKAVEPMKEESEEVHVIALSDALGVPIRVVYLDRSIHGTEDHTANHHDFFSFSNIDGSNKTDATNASTDSSKQENPVPFVTLLYRPGHYDILYPV